MLRWVCFSVIGSAPAMVCAKPGLNPPAPPGTLNPLTSHGCTEALGLAFTQSFAFSTAMPCGTTSRSEEHTSELQSLMRISYAVFCLKTKTTTHTQRQTS